MNSDCDRGAAPTAPASSLLAEARAALREARPDAAEQALRGALAHAPGDAEAHRLLGIALQMGGRNMEAIVELRRALALRPDDASIHMNLGSLLCEAGAADEALRRLRQACALAPGMAAAWYNLGKALKLQMQFEPARAALLRAVEAQPGHAAARLALAHAQASLGDAAAAAASCREALRRRPDDAAAWHALANLKTVRMDAAETAQLAAALQRAGDDASRIELGFALAKALDDQGDGAAAFAALREANQRKRRQAPWDAAAERARVDAILAAFAAPAPDDGDGRGHEAIFIASLPRSGSSLVEQILASHPQVEGANEITDLPAVIEGESRRRGQPFPAWAATATAADWARLGRDYLARTERWRQRSPRFTDKNLLNWQYAGAALRMLPGARVVVVLRDPLETCYSCYRQLFGGGNEFSYDLDDMASCCEDCHRLSRHWLRLDPRRVFDHEHEALLADPERQIRRLLDFCGLAFDPACLDFHRTRRVVLSTASAAQVRQPLRPGASSHGARQRRELAPLRARLRAAGLLAAETETS